MNNGTDSRKDGRTSFQRQKTGAHDGENGFLDIKETTLNERETEQCDEMSSKYYNNKYVVVRAYDNQNMSLSNEYFYAYSCSISNRNFNS